MKKVIIIGGGIAGLSAGVYARRSGFDVTILEQHTIPGGNSTSWKRDGYLFEDVYKRQALGFFSTSFSWTGMNIMTIRACLFQRTIFTIKCALVPCRQHPW